MKNTAVLLLSTPIPLARKGAVADITQFLVTHNGSILHADDHVDSGRGMFLSRLEWDLDGFDIPIAYFDEYFKALAEKYRIEYHLAPNGLRDSQDHQQSFHGQAPGRVLQGSFSSAEQSTKQA